jgi:hypothetical protein
MSALRQKRTFTGLANNRDIPATELISSAKGATVELELSDHYGESNDRYIRRTLFLRWIVQSSRMSR